MMVIDEDVVKFIILKLFQQLAILRGAQASHGDVKPDNLMFSISISDKTPEKLLDSADIQLIDFGCTGPDGTSYGASAEYTPPDNWKGEINDKTTSITYESVGMTSDAETCKKDLYPRKNGSKFDSWSSFITLVELMNLQHPFYHSMRSGIYLDQLRNFEFNKNMLHFSNAYSSKLLDLFEKVLTVKTKLIDGEKVPVRWGVEEVIASDFYKEIEKDEERLRKKFLVFLQINDNYCGGLESLLGSR